MPVIINAYDFENAPCGFLSFYPDGKIVQANQTLLGWIKSAASEVVHIKTLRDILKRGGFLYYQMYVLPLLNMQGYINEISLELASPDNTITSCLFNASARKNDDGSIAVIDAILFNITDRKKYETEILKAKTQAEEEKRRFEFLANTLPNILWTTLPSGKMNFRNDRFSEYFGLFAHHGSVFSLRDVLYPEDLRPAFATGMKALQALAEVQLELRLRTPDGRHRWFFVRIIPCKDAAGKLLLWLGSCTDIHLQKEKQLNVFNSLTLQLSDASTNIRQKALMLKEMAFAQSHLVRSPLSKILGLISLLEDCTLDDETRFILNLLSQSSEELDAIITEIVTKSHEPANIANAS